MRRLLQRCRRHLHHSATTGRTPRSGATVVFSSHVMELVESLCDWVAVMAAGRIRAQGTLAEVRGEAPTLQQAFLKGVSRVVVELQPERIGLLRIGDLALNPGRQIEGPADGDGDVRVARRGAPGHVKRGKPATANDNAVALAA